MSSPWFVAHEPFEINPFTFSQASPLPPLSAARVLTSYLKVLYYHVFILIGFQEYFPLPRPVSCATNQGGAYSTVPAIITSKSLAFLTQLKYSLL